MNLGFGDLLSDGSIDDKATSNNGDILKVLSTVVQILKDFSAEYPNIKIFFSGAAEERTRLYHRIIKTYFDLFNEEFRITGLIGTVDNNIEVLFDPKSDQPFFAFIVKSIINFEICQ